MKINKKFILIFLTVFFCFNFLIIHETNAKDCKLEKNGIWTTCPEGYYCKKTTKKTGNCVSLTINSPVKIAKTEEITVYIGNLIVELLGYIGLIAIIMFIYAGVSFMFSAGDSKKITQRTKLMVWTALGLAVIFSSYIIVKSIIGFF